MTDYVILSQREDEAWEIVGAMSARSASSALRERLDGPGQSSEYRGAGVYVAVPERSWQPLTVSIETRQTLRFK